MGAERTRPKLEKAALDLYGERGFEKTTVAEIAARAGVTERTYFRHFADKREVLFGGTSELQDMLTNTVADAPAAALPSKRRPAPWRPSAASSWATATAPAAARPSSRRTRNSANANSSRWPPSPPP